MAEAETKEQSQEKPYDPNQKPLSTKSPSTEVIENLYTGTAEQTLWRSSYDPNTHKSPYNSDKLYEKSGDYRIYEDMLDDDQVGICLDLKKDLVLGSGFEFVAGEDGQEEMIEELKKVFGAGDDEVEPCETPFLEACEEILTAYEYGFSLSEKVFRIGDDGRLSLKSLKTRHPNTWRIHQDAKGNIEKYVQLTDEGEKEINPKALIHYVNRRRFQNPYGRSDLRVAFNAWVTKRHVTKFYAIFLEACAKPIPVARYNTNAPKQAITDIHNSLKNFQAKTSLTIPKEIELEFLESSNVGEAYSKALSILNMCIGRALFIPDLMGMTGAETGGGSYSLGKEQMGVFFMHIMRRRIALENTVNSHLVKPVILYNYGEVKNPPRLQFKHLDDQAALEAAKVWLEAVKGKVWKASDEEVNWFRALVKAPQGDVDREAPPAAIDPETGLPMPPKPGAPMPGKPGEGDPKDPGNGKKPGEEKPAAEKTEMPEMPAKPEKKGAFAKVFDQPKGDYHKKTDFRAAEAKLDDYDASIAKEAAPIVKRILNDLFDQIERKKIVQNGNVDRIDSLDLKYLKELNNAFKLSFRGIYRDGQVMAQDEVEKGNFKVITDEQFLDVLDKETFEYIGGYRYKILEKTKQALIAAVKDGAQLAAVIEDLRDRLGGLSEISIERFARTKHTEVMNKGRLDYFENTGVVAAYQYSAILDDRTSEICRGLHGKVFRAGTQPVPPMHFNCRSLLIPITKYEEWEPTTHVGKTPIREFIEENKGEGFPVK